MKLKEIFYLLAELFRHTDKEPLYFLVKSQWVERNEPLIVVDVSSDLKPTLKRSGNEEAEFVLVGFRIKK